MAWSSLPYQSNSEFCSLAKPRIAVSVFSTKVICVTVAITCEMFFVVFSVFFAAGLSLSFSMTMCSNHFLCACTFLMSSYDLYACIIFSLRVSLIMVLRLFSHRSRSSSILTLRLGNCSSSLLRLTMALISLLMPVGAWASLRS